MVVWYNGGPGSSALYGYLTEMGPFLTNDASITFDALNKTGGVPELFVNPGGWHGQAHLLWIDSPPPSASLDSLTNPPSPQTRQD